MATDKNTAKQTVYDVITSQIISKLEQGIVPWHMPWSSVAPRNGVTHHAYRGINYLLTCCQSYGNPNWFTFRQVQELGGRVIKGQHSTPVVYWNFSEREDKSTGEKKQSAWVKYYRVFNAEQCEGLPEKYTSVPETSRPNEPIAECERIVKGYQYGPEIKHGATGASYHKITDVIRMPNLSAFDSAEEYYSTLFHEMTHSTGNAKRLNRPTLLDSHAFGDKEYSKEELCAEMGASFLSAIAGIAPRTLDNSAAYIGSWLRKLREDSKLVMSAASAAQRAVDHIVGTSFQDEASDEQTEREIIPAPVAEPIAARAADVVIPVQVPQISADGFVTLSGGQYDGMRIKVRPKLAVPVTSASGTRYEYHDVKLADQQRIPCSHTIGALETCDAPAVVCQHAHWNTGNTTGLSFFYYCAQHDPRGPKPATKQRKAKPAPAIAPLPADASASAVLAQRLVIAARARCPIAALPMPGERPLLVKSKVLKLALRGLVVESARIARGDRRAVCVEGYDAKHRTTRRRFTMFDQDARAAKHAIGIWAKTIRRARANKPAPLAVAA